jgi:WhiB family transcriptional regulator, redox-sensing transcriptional regulator
VSFWAPLCRPSLTFSPHQGGHTSSNALVGNKHPQAADHQPGGLFRGVATNERIRKVNQVLKNGSCVGSGQHELFFSERPDELAAAQAICAQCSVRMACLEMALEEGCDWGVWGGVIFWDGQPFHRKRARGRPRRSEMELPVAASRQDLLELVRSA